MFLKPLSPGGFISDVIDPVEKLGGKVRKIFINHADYPDIRKFGRDVLDINTEVESLKRGLQATMFNIAVYTSRNVLPEHCKVEIEKDEKTGEINWCMTCHKPIEELFCSKPECILAHIHES